ncbi:MAG: hypothetical protein BGO32_13000 [Bacteroidetes bacterium 37-13]|nr:MAG: hypothetical protein BGO32_13000 [Bacteroidetes bacterium 37-13]
MVRKFFLRLRYSSFLFSKEKLLCKPKLKQIESEVLFYLLRGKPNFLIVFKNQFKKAKYSP